LRLDTLKPEQHFTEPPPRYNEASLVKFTAGEWGARTIDHAIQIHGAMGEALELPLTVFYRLLRHLQIGGGTTEMQKMLIARHLLK